MHCGGGFRARRFMSASPWLTDRHRYSILHYMVKYGKMTSCMHILAAAELKADDGWQALGHGLHGRALLLFYKFPCARFTESLASSGSRPRPADSAGDAPLELGRDGRWI